MIAVLIKSKKKNNGQRKQWNRMIKGSDLTSLRKFVNICKNPTNDTNEFVTNLNRL